MVIASIAFLFSFAVINYLYININDSSALAIKWRKMVLLMNISMILLNFIFILTALYLYFYKKSNHILYIWLPYVILVELGIWGILGASIHQLISRSIVPFILMSFAASALLIRPITFFYYCVMVYVCFFFSISIYQSNPDYIALNRVLGFVTLALSYCFSIVFWNNGLLRFRQDRLIELQTRELKEANVSKDKFFSILSHDLKGPVASSLLLTELMDEDLMDEQERKEVTQLFRSSLENISRLINNVLLWANSQTGNISFNPVRVSLNELVEENIQLLRPMASHKKILLINHLKEDHLLFADPHMIHTIFRNLLANAIKFTHEHGTVEISAELLLDGTAHQWVKLTVSDNGIGMPVSFLNDLFRLDKKTIAIGTKDETGTGLGLILCKEFVEKHQGTLDVESTVGKGSRFMVTLPLAK
ncbi:MAG: hypothetical protein JWO58_706 [Chitinophagaceae bacterium]|nr:hypothetical protein [Chitinophagaceae bacterium]